MAADLNITLEQYASYTLDLTITNSDATPYDLTGYTGLFKIAKRGDKTKVLEINGVEADNSIVIDADPTTGIMQVYIKTVSLVPMSTDNNVTIDPSDYYYTLVIYDAAGVKVRILDGLVAIAIGIN
jgi:hypothetical protein